MTDVVVPLGLWTCLPTHNITSVLVTDVGTVFTGSSSGELCLWERSKGEGGELVPKFLLIEPGNDSGSPVVDIRRAELRTPGGGVLPVAVSLTRDAFLRVWTCDDGRCVGECREAAGAMELALALTIVRTPGGQTLAAVAGASHEVCFVDIASKECVLACRVHYDWISHIDSVWCERARAPYFATASNDGTVAVWYVPPGAGGAPEQQVLLSSAAVDSVYSARPAAAQHETPGGDAWDADLVESIAESAATQKKVLAVALSPDAALVAVVFATRVVVLAVDTLAPVAQLCPPAPVGGAARDEHAAASLQALERVDPTSESAMSLWGGGAFAAADTFIAWTELGVGCAYRLAAAGEAPVLLYCTEPPPLQLSSVDENPVKYYGWAGDVHGASFAFANGDTCALYRLPADTALVSVALKRTTPGGGTTTIVASSPGTFYLHRPFFGAGVAKNVSFRGTGLPAGMASAQAGAPHSPEGGGRGAAEIAVDDARGEAVRPLAVGTFSSLLGTAGDASGGGGSSSSSSKGSPSAEWADISCLALLEDLFVLICGHCDGTISCRTLPSDPEPRVFRAHTKRVTALYAPEPNNQVDKWRVVVSASDDFTIKVWRLFSFELHHCFNMHSGSVRYLVPFAAPPMPTSSVGADGQPLAEVDTSSLYTHSLMSIGDDRCIAIFDLQSLQCQHWLPGHSSPVVDVRWKVEQGFLMVSCLDSTLYVWELASGSLVCKLSGSQARATLSNYCISVFSADDGFQSMSAISPLGISAGAVRVGEPKTHVSPILCMVLADVAQVLEALGSGPSPFVLARKFAWSPAGSGVVAPGLRLPDDPARRTAVYMYPPLSLLAYFIAWGVCPAMDEACAADLLLRRPLPEFSLGYVGEGGNCSFALPARGGGAAAPFMALSPSYSALAGLMCLSMVKLLSHNDTLARPVDKLLSFVKVGQLAASIPGFVDPSLEDLVVQLNSALSCLSSARTVQMDIASAARILITVTVARAPREQVRAAVAAYRQRLSVRALSPEEAAIDVCVLGMYAIERERDLDTNDLRFISSELEHAVTSPSMRLMFPVLVDVLVRGVCFWKPCLPDAQRPLRHLFALSTGKGGGGGPVESQAAQRGLYAIGIQDPGLFVAALSEEVREGGSNYAVLELLGKFVNRWDPTLVDYLPAIVDLTIQALDPTHPSVRDRCIKPATAVVAKMISMYPMTAFHQDSQKIAVGSKGCVVMYDIKTGNKSSCALGGWVCAACFSPSGKTVATYTSESKLSIWQVTGILSTLKILTRNKTPDWVYTPPRTDLTPTAPTKEIRLQWTVQSGLVLLLPGADEPFIPKVAKNL